MYKAGVVTEKNLSEWFDPHNLEHMKAFACLTQTGRWPPGWLPSDVWHDPGWDEVVYAKIEETGWPDEALAWAGEWVRVWRVVRAVACPGHTFHLYPLGDYFLLEVATTGDGPEELPGRRWFFSPGLAEQNIVRTCFQALVSHLEDRALDRFTYQDQKWR